MGKKQIDKQRGNPPEKGEEEGDEEEEQRKEGEEAEGEEDEGEPRKQKADDIQAWLKEVEETGSTATSSISITRSR